MIQNHKAKHCVRIAGTLATLVLGLELSVLPAQASLSVQIAGTAGSGSTTWTFSGSDTAGGSGVFDSSSQIIDGEWQDLGDFTDLNILDVPGDGGSIVGSATLTIEAASRTIDSVFIDDEAGLNDDFAKVTTPADYNPSCKRIVFSSEATSHLCGAVIFFSSSSNAPSPLFCDR